MHGRPLLITKTTGTETHPIGSMVMVYLQKNTKKTLVGGFNPFEKYARQNGFIFPTVRGEHKKYLSCHHYLDNDPININHSYGGRFSGKPFRPMDSLERAFFLGLGIQVNSLCFNMIYSK